MRSSRALADGNSGTMHRVESVDARQHGGDDLRSTGGVQDATATTRGGVEASVGYAGLPRGLSRNRSHSGHSSPAPFPSAHSTTRHARSASSAHHCSRASARSTRVTHRNGLRMHEVGRHRRGWQEHEAEAEGDDGRATTSGEFSQRARASWMLLTRRSALTSTLSARCAVCC